MLKRWVVVAVAGTFSCVDCSPSQFTLSVSPEEQTIRLGQDAVVTVRTECSSNAAIGVGWGAGVATVQCRSNGTHPDLTVTLPASQLGLGRQKFVFDASSRDLHGRPSDQIFVNVEPAPTGPGVDVMLVGTGGTVTSTPAGINCPGTCSTNVAAHTSVTLTAVADETHRFAGWSGDAACATGQVYVDEARVHCTATFTVKMGADWLQLSGPLNASPATTAAEVTGNALIFDASGQPLAAWVENKTLRVSRKDATGWAPLSATPPSTSAAGAPSLSLDGTAPLVAWTEDDGMGAVDVFVARFEAGTWTKLGAGPVDRDPAQVARDPSLAGPYVAWVETEAGGLSRIVVRRYQNGTWSNPASAELPAASGLRAPKLARSTQGLAVAWATASSVQASELLGTLWSPMTPDPFTGLAGNFPFDFGASYSDGWVLVASPFQAGTFQPKRWKGFWENLGTPRGTATTLPSAIGLSHAALAGDPVIAWHELLPVDQTVVEQFSGGAWVRLGSPVSTPNRQNTKGTSLGVRVAQGTVPVLLETVGGTVGSANDATLRAWEFR